MGDAMHVRQALDQIEQIHEHLTRSEVYRGFRVPAVALVGILAFVAALGQPMIAGTAAADFISYWVAVAGACALIGTATAVHLYSVREDAFERRRTRRVLIQFAPCIAVGAVVTIAVARVPDMAAFLPGIWASIFGLGIISTRPHLPVGIGSVGVAYIAAGAAILITATPGEAPSGWQVGVVFGVGHMLTAVVLWRDATGECHDGF